MYSPILQPADTVESVHTDTALVPRFECLNAYRPPDPYGIEIQLGIDFANAVPCGVRISLPGGLQPGNGQSPHKVLIYN